MASKKPAFTIVELLVVIVVIGVLAAITVVSYTGITQKATVASLVSDLNNASKLLKMDQVINGVYPATLAAVNGGNGIPSSPDTTYQYMVYNTTPQTFCVSATKSSQTYRLNSNSEPVAGSCIEFGTTADKPGKSCYSLMLDGFDTDGVFWIDADGLGVNTPFQVYCDMTYSGGGWTMLMKATRGTTFEYDAPYWTTANTLNDSNVNRSDGDAKYRSFNEMPLTDIMARWPDAGDMRWLRNAAWSNTTALVGFDTFADWGDPLAQSYWNSIYFSYQTGIKNHGTKLRDLNTSSGARWGNRYNNETYYGSDDVGNGIGLYASLTSRRYSAGDWIACCQVGTGMVRSARVEVYGRNSNDTAD